MSPITSIGDFSKVRKRFLWRAGFLFAFCQFIRERNDELSVSVFLKLWKGEDTCFEIEKRERRKPNKLSEQIERNLAKWTWDG